MGGSATLRGTGTLWARKPLCRSCMGAVKQVATLFPHLRLDVSVGSLCSDGGANSCAASSTTSLPRGSSSGAAVPELTPRQDVVSPWLEPRGPPCSHGSACRLCVST